MFGIRGAGQVREDLALLLSGWRGGGRYAVDASTAGLFRPDLSLPAYAGRHARDGLAPIFNLFDRVGGGRGYSARITRRAARDYRGGRLTYDDHDGTDFVCPPGTPVVAAAPGLLVAVRDTWLRGGLTACVDHGGGVVTQYTHLWRVTAEIGQALRRGEPLGLSGASGLDMVSGFPWVPPHVHFMVFLGGMPTCPFSAGLAEGNGLWLAENEPRPSGPLPGERPPGEADLCVDEAALEAILPACRSTRLEAELGRARSAAGRLAIVEDSLHHEREAWDLQPPRSEPLRPSRLRREAKAPRVRLSLPLPGSLYRGARPADAAWTRPPETFRIADP